MTLVVHDLNTLSNLSVLFLVKQSLQSHQTQSHHNYGGMSKTLPRAPKLGEGNNVLSSSSSTAAAAAAAPLLPRCPASTACCLCVFLAAGGGGGSSQAKFIWGRGSCYLPLVPKLLVTAMRTLQQSTVIIGMSRPIGQKRNLLDDLQKQSANLICRAAFLSQIHHYQVFLFIFTWHFISIHFNGRKSIVNHTIAHLTS